jgi:hypothetical protein
MPTRDLSEFLSLPDEDRLCFCHQDFQQATRSESLRHAVCAVCAQEVSFVSGNAHVLALSQLPNSYRLVPWCPHPEHDLWDGRLLRPAGFLSKEAGTETLNAGGSCFNNLQENKTSLFCRLLYL